MEVDAAPESDAPIFFLVPLLAFLMLRGFFGCGHHNGEKDGDWSNRQGDGNSATDSGGEPLVEFASFERQIGELFEFFSCMRDEDIDGEIFFCVVLLSSMDTKMERDARSASVSAACSHTNDDAAGGITTDVDATSAAACLQTNDDAAGDVTAEVDATARLDVAARVDATTRIDAASAAAA